MTLYEHDARGYWEKRGLVLLWVSMLSGPIAAALNLQLGYALVKWACAARRTDVLILLTVASLAIAVVGAALGWWCLARIGAAAEEQGGRQVDRSHFLALTAIGFNTLLILLMFFWTIPPFVLSPCE